MSFSPMSSQNLKKKCQTHLCVCLCLCMCTEAVPSTCREGAWSLGTGVRDGYEPPCGCWKLNPGPLQEKLMLLTTGPSFQLPYQTADFGDTFLLPNFLCVSLTYGKNLSPLSLLS